jgi:hypothetical protein
MPAWLRLVVILAIPAVALGNGLVVYRASGKLEFSSAVQFKINGKDKVLVLGEQLAAPPKSMPSQPLNTTLLRDAKSGVMVLYRQGAPPRYAYPDGVSRKVPQPAPDAWRELAVEFKRTQADKSAESISSSTLIAYLPGGVDELASLCMDVDALALLGEPGKAFPMQLEFVAAALEAHGTQPAMKRVEQFVHDFMQVRMRRFEQGAKSAEALDEGLAFARISRQFYAGDAAHERLRQELAASRQWLDRRVAVLRALAAGLQWDAFILAFRDFEKHQGSFPALAKMHREAMETSLAAHWNLGKERLARGQFRGAYREFRMASLRRPSDGQLQRELAMARTEFTRAAAVDSRSRRKTLSAGQRELLKQALQFSERYREQKNLDAALKHVLEAESIDAEALPVLLTKARIQGERGEIAAALETLDAYDLHAVEEERAAGSKLRNDLLFQLTDGLDKLGKKMAAAFGQNRFHESLRLAKSGLLANPQAPAFLRGAGLASLAVRQREEGINYLRAYLKASNSLDANPEERAAVYQLLAQMPPAGPSPPQGEPHWFSGVPVPAGVLYCPASLAFAARVDRVAGSNKFSLRFTWAGGQLRSITPAFERGVAVTPEKPFVFSYNSLVPHAVGVDAGETPREPITNPDEILSKANVILPNFPFADPLMIHRLTGRNSVLAVAGNPYFHPFVWDRPYHFAVDHDEMGRARVARELPARDEAPRPLTVVEFSWDGLKLTAVRASEVSSPADASPRLVYERTLRYEQGRLASEEIRSRGRTSTIKYKWTGSQLVSAECSKDEAHDGRSRDVFFAP